VELKVYLRAIRRRWPIIVLLPLLIGLMAIYQQSTRDDVYAVHIRASVLRHPDPPIASEYQYEAYYNYLSSEFAIDDLVEAIRGNVFAAAVAERASAEGPQVGAGEAHAAIAADRRHRILNLTVRSGDPAIAESIARAAAAELEERAFHYLGVETAGTTAIVQIIDRPGGAVVDTGRQQLMLLLQLVAAVGAGVLLAFLVDYLDDTLYDAEMTEEAIRLPHLASVPAESRT
jgi:capsular polysaccharide biosynthesis protein